MTRVYKGEEPQPTERAQLLAELESLESVLMCAQSQLLSATTIIERVAPRIKAIQDRTHALDHEFNRNFGAHGTKPELD